MYYRIMFSLLKGGTIFYFHVLFFILFIVDESVKLNKDFIENVRIIFSFNKNKKLTKLN